ncbi:hypothetical protein PR048_001876 [Dryococelus australis]|uniref:Uncharacterized protein n=1 Tax=Dryococelus australis TaxID=614101 RepID=A0ABQ9IIP4_9NEOP|nr:hypothetical protein PR048_001876 [Dryococelus australis]
MSSCAEEYLLVGQYFKDKWNSPYCVGTIHGHRCAIQRPPSSGSEYSKNKQYFISDYCFLFADVGRQRCISDVGDNAFSLHENLMKHYLIESKKGGSKKLIFN